MRAKIHDATGPRWTRLVLPALGAIGMLAGIYWWTVDGPPPGVDFFAGLALVLAAPLILGRHAPRGAEVRTHPGRIEVRHAGLLSQTIATREVLGASTCASAGGVTLALEREGRESPTLLELANEADAKAVRDALGIGHHGFGTLSWPLCARPVDKFKAFTLAVAAAAAALLAYCTFMGQDPTALGGVPLLFLVMFFPLMTIGAWLRARESAQNRRIWLTPEDVRVQDGRDTWVRVPYGTIESVGLSEGWFAITSNEEAPVHARTQIVRHARRGLSRMELAHVIAQVEAAARRARGDAAPAPSVGGAAPLARQEGEPVRAWLERLKATARQVRDSPGYRGAAVAEADLWAALENHDADPVLRAGAARVLSRIAAPPELARIDAVLAAVRDDGAKRRIRVALDPDLERATSEIEEIEADAALAVRR